MEQLWCHLELRLVSYVSLVHRDLDRSIFLWIMALRFPSHSNGHGRVRSVAVHYWNGVYNMNRGVFYLQSDSVSADHLGRNLVADMHYNFAYDCNASGILGHENTKYFGRVRDLFPNAEKYGTNARYFQHGVVTPPGIRHIRMACRGLETDDSTLYYAWVVHSDVCVGSDGIHCPVNFLWQDPSMVLSDRYHWYVLMDCYHPSQWLEANEVYLNGTFDAAPVTAHTR